MYSKHAAQLGQLLAKYNVRLIYGGGGKGIMKTIADHVMENGGTVIGVIPKILIDWEHQHKNITKLIVSEDMHSRKKTMYQMCDAALVLPGGLGTLDELFEMLTWNQLNIHNKKIFIMNSAGFFDHLIQHITQLEKNGFLYEPAEKRIKYLNDPLEFEVYLNSNGQNQKL